MSASANRKRIFNKQDYDCLPHLSLVQNNEAYLNNFFTNYLLELKKRIYKPNIAKITGEPNSSKVVPNLSSTMYSSAFSQKINANGRDFTDQCTREQKPLIFTNYSWIKNNIDIKETKIIDITFQDPFRQYYESLEECEKYLCSWQSVCLHINKHRRVRPYKCSLCNKCYANISGLKRHAIKKHDSHRDVYKCATCFKRFYSTTHFENHIKFEISQNVKQSKKELPLNSIQYEELNTNMSIENLTTLEQIMQN
ncbi:oocyte zinc finger protein XlCOF7.2-like [Condylostylus longicornis]|uniref:oocyte zinc finger protein XlCOF7.2-like n=1 Tax=Condylostylus longicornis TaxID=2530218 RepID=UPI00244E3627|nr:oocyte zinc finger protein XlCOF7.2-like [Condylostylus longicornis]